MTTDEFLNEVLSSDICPNNFEEMYRTFNSYQTMIWNTLLSFDGVCKKNNIPYQLAYGSLLGAIRDNGQIPWDYDIDVFVPFEEREKLISALYKDLDKNNYFYCPEVDPKCRHEMLRITPVGYRSEKLHVDVFFMIGVGGKTPTRNKLIDKLHDVYQGRFYKLVNIEKETKGNIKRRLKFIIKRALYSFRSVEKMHLEYLDICQSHPVSGSTFCITADQYGRKYIYPTKDIWNLSTININGHDFSIPSNADEILRLIYGDYMSVPPLTGRVNEMKTHYKALLSAKE